MGVAANAVLGAGVIAAATIGIDQASKAYVRGHHHAGVVHDHLGHAADQIPIVHDFPGTDEVSIVYVENEGMLGGSVTEGSTLASALALPLLPAVGAAVLYAGASRGASPAMRIASVVGAGLLAGGALSNGVEKLVRGRATDMLFISRTGTAWNGADVAIGAGMLVSFGVIGARLVRGMR